MSIAIDQKQPVVPEADDDELGVLCSFLDVVGHDGDVLKIEGRVNLVHDVERGRLVIVESEDERQGRESLFSTGQIGDVLPRLLWRPFNKSRL